MAKSSKTQTLNATQHALVENARMFADVDGAVFDKGAAFVGLFSELTVEDFKAHRACWIGAYDAAHGTVSGARRFTELVNLYGVIKPQSEEAKRKQAQREAAKAAKDAAQQSEVIDVESRDVTPPTTGIEAAGKVKMELSSSEAHLVALFRAGKFEMLTEYVASVADQA